MPEPAQLGSRRSRILGGPRSEGARSTLIAVVSTVVFFGLVVLLVTNAPGWPEVKRSFFSGEQFR